MKRRKFTSKFKTKVVLEALSGRYTIQELARKHEVHATQIGKWKSVFLENAESIFEQASHGRKAEEAEAKDQLLRIIGEQKVQLDFLRKASSELGL